MKKLVLIFFSIFAFALSFVPQGSQAATSQYGFGWIDRQTINSQFMGPFMYDSIQNIGGDQKIIFKRQTDPDGCPDTLEIYKKYNNSGAASDWSNGVVTYHESAKSNLNNTNCNPVGSGSIDVVITDGGNNYNLLDWIDSATIRPLPQASDDLGTLGDFIMNPTTKQYVQQGGGNCHSYIDDVTSSTQRGGALHLLLDPSSSSVNTGTMINYQGCYQVREGAVVNTVITGSQDHTIHDNILSVSLGTRENFAKTGTPQINPQDAPPGPGTTTPKTDECATQLASYAWIACPAYDKSENFLKTIYTGFIQPYLLEVDPLDTKSTLKKVVDVIISIANIFFIIVFLIMIFGTTMNISSYTVKKTLPKLIIAAVSIQFAFFICGFVVDIGNILGGGIQDLVASAFGVTDAQNRDKGLINYMIMGGGVGIIGGAILLGPAVLFIALGLVMAILGFIFTLLIRKVLITMLIIAAPLALAAAVLPNTEQYFKKWYQAFIRVIMVYPIISVILSAGYIAKTAITSTPRIAADSNVVTLVGAIVSIAAFAMMPMAFKWGGSVMGVASKIGSKYSGAEAGRAASMKAGKAPIKTAYAGFGKNHAARVLAQRNASFAKGGFMGRRAGLNLGNGLGSGWGPTNITPGRRAASKAIYDRNKSAATSAGRSLENEQVKNFATSMEEQDNTAVLTAAQSSSGAERQAAVNTLAARGRTADLTTLQNDMTHAEFAKVMKNVPAADAKAVRAQAPHLGAESPEKAAATYNNLSASDLTKLNADGWKGLNTHVQNSADPAAARQDLDDKLDIIGVDTHLRGEFKPNSIKFARIISEDRVMPSDTELNNMDAIKVDNLSYNP